MSNAMRDRMSAAKSGAGKSVKAKTAKAPLLEPTVDLRLVPDATVTELTPPTQEDSSTAMAEAVEVLVTDAAAAVPEDLEDTDDEPIVLPRVTRSNIDDMPPVPLVSSDTSTAIAPSGPTESTAVTPVHKRKALKGEALLTELTAPPAAMGTAGESRIMSVPMSEDTYRLLQQLDRDLALSRRRPVNRVRLVTAALEQVLGDPGSYADRYLRAHAEGVTWKRRVQARVPVEMADQLPLLRYTGEQRQSAGMLVSIAVAAILNDARAHTART